MQQSVEKALKALCIIGEIEFPKTHSVDYLMDLLEQSDLVIPENVQKAKILTDYAVSTRYPGVYEPVTEEATKEALEISQCVIHWVEEQLKG